MHLHVLWFRLRNHIIVLAIVLALTILLGVAVFTVMAYRRAASELHGLLGFTKALAMEAANHNIHVNAVCPGTVESMSLEGIAAQTGLEGEPCGHFSQGHLFQDRRIAPEDIACAVRWLASEESRCITGTVLSVDAGWSARA